SIIEISDTEKIYLHYDDSLTKVIFIQYFNEDTDHLGEFHPKNNLLD
ncbi:unnamed protein product, partial [marine sediment metagenome]